MNLALAFLLAAWVMGQEPPAQTPETETEIRAIRTIEIPLLNCSGLPCVDMATATGKTLRLLIDTGNVNSYLDTKVAQAMGLPGESLKGSEGAAIGVVQRAFVPGAKLGDLPMGDFPFMVLDTTPDQTRGGQKPPRLPADGALAYSAFRNRILQIDYGNRALRISEPQSDIQPCPQNCAKLFVKHIGRFGPVTLIAEGFLVNGQPVDAQIDTLFTGTMLVYSSSVEKLGLKKLKRAKGKEFFPFTQDGVKLGRADGAATISFGSVRLMQDAPLYFASEDGAVASGSFDATVGIGLLSHAVVTFDFKSMQMWVADVR